MKNYNFQAIKYLYTEKKMTYWLFKCDCGSEKVLRANKVFVKNKPIKTCRCGNGKNKNYAFYSVLRSYKVGSLRRNLEFSLSEKEFEILTSSDCFYCGIPPNKTSKTTLSFYKYNGVDRKNNNIGYVLDNCLPCCTLCNKAKCDLPYNVFISWLNSIKKFNTKNY